MVLGSLPGGWAGRTPRPPSPRARLSARGWEEPCASASATQGVWRADWHLAGSGEQFYQPDILARTAGLLAHVQEEYAEGKPMQFAGIAPVEYVGPVRLDPLKPEEA